MLFNAGMMWREREMNVGWDQIGGMYACIYHFIFLHAFLHDTAIHAVSNIRKTNFCQKVRHVIFLSLEKRENNSKLKKNSVTKQTYDYQYSHQNFVITFETMG